MSVKSGGDGSQPLIPDIAGITKAVCTQLSDDKKCGSSLKIVEEHFRNDAREDANVEEMLSHIRALRVVAGKDEVRRLSAASLDDLDSEICRIIHELADKTLPSSETPYHRVALWTDAARRAQPVEIFTTNYDLLMEQAYEDCRVAYFDGFAGSRKPFFDIRAMEEDVLPPRWARLWKLHGSINWYQDPSKGVLRGSANETNMKRVIHPSHLKYDESRRMPYLAMMDRLRAFLRRPSAVLVLCGYSFRDEHINEVIMQGLQGTQTAIAFGLLFNDLAHYPKAVKLGLQRANLSLLGKDKAVISGREAGWSEKGLDLITAESSDAWVSWVPVDPKEDKGKQRAIFTLGDFAAFGHFLHELVGQVRRQSEIPSAK